MADFRLSANAAAELDEILDWSEINFGAAAQKRYTALLFEAMQAIADDPRQPDVRWRRVRQTEVGIYHIAFSRDRTPAELGRVGDPRHAVVFRVGADGVVDILGFVHDSMLRARAFMRLAKE